MRKQFLAVLFTFFLGALCALPAAAQMATVKGTVTGPDGKPAQGDKIEFVNKDNGQKYNLKSDKKGQFFSIGVTAGKYKVTLYGPDGKQLTFYDNVSVSMNPPNNEGANIIDFNLQQLQQQAEAQAAGIQTAAPGQPQRKLSAEEQKQLEERQKAIAEQQKEVTTVKNLNALLASSKTAADAGNLDQAIQQMQQATQVDQTRDVIWAVLGDYELRKAKTAGIDAETKKKLNADAVEAYTKAIEDCDPAKVAKPATSCKDVASYHNNLGQALAGSGKTQDAIAEYEKAAQLNPGPAAAQYYFNEGAILTNSGKPDEANAAFDKAIAADPNRADAYFQKGVNMLAKATFDKEGHMVAPPGAKESIEKYLQLQPDGPYAANAKELLTAMGQKIETSYGSGKKKGK